MKTNDTKKHLCDTCALLPQMPECMDEDAEFGDGEFNDNIIKCDNYEPIE